MFSINLVKNWLILYQSVTTNLPENEEDIIIPGDNPSLDFSVQFYQGAYDKLNSPDIRWYIDGTHMPAYDQLSTIKINTLTLGPGKHTVKIGVSGYIKGTGGFIRSTDDNASYYEFPEFEIAKGTYKRKK